MEILSVDFTGTTTSDYVTLSGDFSVSIKDFGSATILLERSLNGTDWGLVETFTANTEQIGEAAGSTQLRFRCSVYGSGTINCTISI